MRQPDQRGIAADGAAIRLAYDAAGRITAIRETGLPEKSFGYDALDRLHLWASGKTAVNYAYDPDGNRTALSGHGRTTTYGFGDSNRLLRSTGSGTENFAYDKDGNLTADDKPATDLGFVYDASGRLVEAKTGAYATRYMNDGLGERVSRAGYGASDIPGGKESFVYDRAGHLIGEYDGNGRAIEETVWLGDLAVAVLMPGKAPFYVAPDHLGAPHLIANAARNTVWHWDHDPFGNGAPTGPPPLQSPLPRPVLRQ